jgi:hypothetical protein
MSALVRDRREAPHGGPVPPEQVIIKLSNLVLNHSESVLWSHDRPLGPPQVCSAPARLSALDFAAARAADAAAPAAAAFEHVALRWGAAGAGRRRVRGRAGVPPRRGVSAAELQLHARPGQSC